MYFSLALFIFVILAEDLAIKKDKQNQQKRRCTQSKFGDHDCTSSKTTLK